MEEFRTLGSRRTWIIQTDIGEPVCGILEDQKAENNVVCLSPAHEVSEGNWAMGYSCCSLAKYLVAVCLCLKNLSEAEFKADVLICWVEGILRQDNIVAVSQLLLL